MNIEEYRAMKAQELEQKESSAKEEPEVKQEENKTIVETPEIEKKEEVKIPDEIEIDGVGKVKIDELKRGYLRQDDYTRKTQDLARSRKEVQQALELRNLVMSNPEIAKEIADKSGNQSLTPEAVRIQELETKMYDMMLENEIDKLKSKYDDFDVRQVLKVADERNITDLEAAYLLTRKSGEKEASQNVDIEALKEKLRKEIVDEIEKERESTKTIIKTNSPAKSVERKEVRVSEAEEKVAKHMFRTSKDPISDYVKWRDIKA